MYQRDLKEFPRIFPKKRLTSLAFFLSVALAFTCGSVAEAQTAEGELVEKEGDLATKWKVNDADPKSSIPSMADRNRDPLEFAYFLQDLAARAEGSFRRSDWHNAIRYYEALGHAVPESWVSFNRLCTAYGKQGRFAIAAGNCGKAITLPMAKVIDHIRLIEYSLKSERFGPAEVKGVEESLAHLKKHVVDHPQPPLAQVPAAAPADPKAPERRTKEEIIEAVKSRQEKRVLAQLAGEDPDKKEASVPVMHLPTEIELLTCRLAVKIQDATRLGACVEELRRLNVHDGEVMAFSWARALIAKDEKSASEVLEKARGLGVPQPTLAAMTAQHKQHFPSTFTPKRLLPILALVLAGGVVGTAFFRMRRKKLGGAHS